MMKTNRMRELVKLDRPVIATRVSSSWPTITEAVGSTGLYDYIEFLAEYAPFDQYDLENVVRAAELHGMGTMIKVDYQNRGYVAQRAIASGFQAILFTDHKTADEVAETIRLIRPECPGHGDGVMGYANRRWIGYRAITPQIEFADMASGVVVNLMIEKKEAVDNIEAICQVPGVDMVQFGPYDYSMSRGFDHRDHADEVKAAERKVIETAIKHGVRPRAELVTPEQAQYYIDLGVRDFALGSEIAIKLNWWRSEGQKLRGMLGM